MCGLAVRSERWGCVWTALGQYMHVGVSGGVAHMAVVSWRWRGADRVRTPCWVSPGMRDRGGSRCYVRCVVVCLRRYRPRAVAKRAMVLDCV
jgi:hypothetical protein